MLSVPSQSCLDVDIENGVEVDGDVNVGVGVGGVAYVTACAI